MTIDIEFTGDIWYWRGPSPFYFITIPEEQSLDIKAVSGMVTYGWGAIPVHARIGDTQFKTSIFPKDGNYIVPVKASVRDAEGLQEGSSVSVKVEVRV